MRPLKAIEHGRNPPKTSCFFCLVRHLRRPQWTEYHALPMDSTDGLLFRDDPEDRRFVAELGGRVIASCQYRRHGSRWFLIHTEVDVDYEGQGIGAGLAQYALDEIRRQGGTVVPICPLVDGFIAKNPDYADLVDHEVWERVKKSLKSGSG